MQTQKANSRSPIDRPPMKSKYSWASVPQENSERNPQGISLTEKRKKLMNHYAGRAEKFSRNQ